MTWTKLSDDFADEAWTLSDAAFRTLVEMLTFSNRKLLDCLIPKDDLRRFAKNPEAVVELAAGGWIVDQGSSWQIRFHAAYQPGREQVVKLQEVSRENGRRGGRPRKPTREMKPNDLSGTRVGTGVGFVDKEETQPETQPATQQVGTGLASYGSNGSETEKTPRSAPAGTLQPQAPKSPTSTSSVVAPVSDPWAEPGPWADDAQPPAADSKVRDFGDGIRRREVVVGNKHSWVPVEEAS